jgi:hypothetical protein
MWNRSWPVRDRVGGQARGPRPLRCGGDSAPTDVVHERPYGSERRTGCTDTFLRLADAGGSAANPGVSVCPASLALAVDVRAGRLDPAAAAPRSVQPGSVARVALVAARQS